MKMEIKNKKEWKLNQRKIIEKRVSFTAHYNFELKFSKHDVEMLARVRHFAVIILLTKPKEVLAKSSYAGFEMMLFSALNFILKSIFSTVL